MRAFANHISRLALTALAAATVTLLAPNMSDAAAPLGQLSIFTPSVGRAPSSVIAGPDGNIWFTESSTTSTTPLPDGRMPHGAIGRITPAGKITEFPTAGQANYITVGPHGNLWFTETNVPVPMTIQSDVAVAKITPSGAITEYRYGNAGYAPQAITEGSDGNLWVADGHLIDRVTTAGVITHFCITPDGTGSLSGHGIVTGPDGNLWFTDDTGRSVWKASTTGMVSAPSCTSPTPFRMNDQQFPTGLSASYRPQGLTVGPDGALWYGLLTGGAAPGRVGRITTAGAVSSFPFSPDTNSTNIVTGPDGKLWFADNSTAIYRMTTSGAFTRFDLATRLSPFSLAAGPDGNLWLVDDSAHIARFGDGPPLQRPTVTKLSPNKGPSSGGTVVTITGTHLSGATAVHFGARVAKIDKLVSATEIKVTSPKGSGTVDVTVTTAAGASAKTKADRYTY